MNSDYSSLAFIAYDHYMICHSPLGPQEKEMEKQKILYQQARLHARGAAEMVLQMISASKGEDVLYLQYRCDFRALCTTQHVHPQIIFNPNS